MVSIYNPVSWLALTTFIGVSYLPLVIFWFYSVYRQAVAGPDSDVEWFHNTARGFWRIPAKVFFGWFLSFAAKGVAQFFAWQFNLDDDGLPTDPPKDNWEYPAAMLLFLISVFIDCLWLGAFFSVHNKFLTSTVFLLIQAAISVFLIVLYFMLSITAGIIFILYSAFVTLPLVIISVFAYRSHERASNDRGQAVPQDPETTHNFVRGNSPSTSTKPREDYEPRPRSAPLPKKRPNAKPPAGAFAARKKQLQSLGMWPQS